MKLSWFSVTIPESSRQSLQRRLSLNSANHGIAGLVINYRERNLVNKTPGRNSHLPLQPRHVFYSNHRSFSSLSKEAATSAVDAPVSARWWTVPPANAVHLSIGSVYVYSMWTPGMTHSLGVVSASAMDWSHAQVLPVFSASAIMLGLTTGLLGEWVEKVGPRKAGVVGSVFWSAALVTTAAGVHFHSIEMVYAGWGLMGGIGWGLMYLAPVTTVMKWFPDRRGLATGIALSAFGAGAAIAPIIIQPLIDSFAVMPDYIGPLSELSDSLTTDQYVTLTTLKDGTQVVAEQSLIGTPGTPVVVATDLEVSKLPSIITGPGAYVLGTGDTGVAKAMGSLGLFYGALGILGSRFMSLPHPDWTPTKSSEVSKSTYSSKSSSSDTEAEKNEAVNSNNIGLPMDYVTRSTRQFPLLWLSVFGNATGGLALLTSSKLMLTDIWTGVAPDIVTASFATAYVSALGIGMAVGRFGWSALSDYLGRRNTYVVFGLGIPVIALAPSLTHAAVHMDSSGSVLPLLCAFCGGSILAITFYGGIFSVLPAYIADLFGQKHAGALHGKLLTAWACSAVAGPMGLAYLRGQSAQAATQELIQQVEDPTSFQQAFGCSLEDPMALQTLIDAKTITIARLMELVPPGTIDPTPFLYDSSCYAAASLMGISLLSNLLIKPLDIPCTLKELEMQSINTK
jgi:MFS family permease